MDSSRIIASLILLCLITRISAQSTIPAVQDGFWYGGKAAEESVLIEAFFDPVCPDSRDSWPPLKDALHYYASRVQLVLHTFPLPYHDNAFATSRALHITHKLNPSATYHVLEAFFHHQKSCAIFYFMLGHKLLYLVLNYPGQMLLKKLPTQEDYSMWLFESEPFPWLGHKNIYFIVDPMSQFLNDDLRLPAWKKDTEFELFYGKATLNKSKASVVDEIVNFTAKALGNSYHSAIKSGFNDTKTDHSTRISFKYGCLRGVYGTPFFFVNGFPLPDAGSALNYTGWRKVIDPLVAQQSTYWQENKHSL